MHALFQRLRELDWDTFQRLAQQLLAARHPSLGIKHVEGAGGDKGLDLFSGTLAGGPNVWQCKHFPNGLKAKQRPQVVKSLDDAITNFHPQNWILVISIDLDTPGHEWFQGLQKDYASKARIGLFQASDIVRELIYRRNIRETFFPGAVFDTIAVRRSLEGLGTMDRATIEALMTKGLDEQIARLEEADARFDYRISYGPNAGPEIAEAGPLGPLHIATVTNGPMKTEIFARDIEALRLDPPRINFSVKGKGAEKLLEFYRTGRPQQLLSEEVTVPRSAFDFVFPDAQATGWQVHLLPSVKLTERVLSWKIAISKDGETIVYDLVKLKPIALGSEQVELQSVSELPFVLGLTLPTNVAGSGGFTFTERFAGFDMAAVAKAIRMKHLLLRGATVQLHSLDPDLPLGSVQLSEAAEATMSGVDRAHLDIAEVASAFGWRIPFPEKITEEDLLQLAVLVAIVRGQPVPIGSLNCEITKNPSTIELLLQCQNVQLEVVACYPSLVQPSKFFGVAVQSGPIQFHCTDAKIANAASILQQLENASENERLEMTVDVGEVYAERKPTCEFAFLVRPILIGEPPIQADGGTS
jgi:hypothetical protein